MVTIRHRITCGESLPGTLVIKKEFSRSTETPARRSTTSKISSSLLKTVPLHLEHRRHLNQVHAQVLAQARGE